MTDHTAPSSDARKRNAERDMPDAHETARARDAGCATHFTVHADGWITNNMTGERFQPRTRTHAINPDTGHFTPIQEDPMTAKDRHDELVALLTEIRDRLPEPTQPRAQVGIPTSNPVKVTVSQPDFSHVNESIRRAFARVGKPTPEHVDVTEEPPVGTFVVDRDDRVWERCEGGWIRCRPSDSGVWRGPSQWAWDHVYASAPLRLATPADLARVGIVQPAPTDDLPGEPVEPGDLRAGDRVAFTFEQERITCTLVSDPDGMTLFSDVPGSGGYAPNVVVCGGWCDGISDVRLIERAPREDEDPNEALAKTYERAERAERACRTLGKVVEDQCRDALNATGLHHLIGEDGDGDWMAVWENLAELRPRAEKAESDRDALRERIEALRADVQETHRHAVAHHEYAASPTHIPSPHAHEDCAEQARDSLADILARDDERAKGEQR